MKTGTIHISEKVHIENTIKSHISFKKFVDFLRETLAAGASIKGPYFKWILKKFEALPELSESVKLEDIPRYEEMLELISTCLLPLASDESKLWAMTSALSPEIFYGTDGFYDLVKHVKKAVAINPAHGTVRRETEKIDHEFLYGLILDKIYGIPYLNKSEWVRKFEDPETGLDKYYLVHMDTRFVEVQPVGEIPRLDCTIVLPSSVWDEEFQKVKKLLPLDQFEAYGFGIITLTEVTAQQAVEEIGKLIIDNAGGNMVPLFQEINHSLQTIAGSRHYQFGVVPFLTINDRPALLYENFPLSVLIQACWGFEVSKKEFASLRADFTKNPRPIFWIDDENNSQVPEVIANAFRHAGIRTYIMFPVYHNKQLTGIFEISTKAPDAIMMSEGQIMKLRPALPLISQLIQNIVARFNTNIENIIKEKFTSIQPAVQWKFNETAWHYLRDHLDEDGKDPVENIIFRNLHPLYGAVDIRNSTILRNQALAKDFTVQLNHLIDMLNNLDPVSRNNTVPLRVSAQNWLQLIPHTLTTQQEIRLNDFFNLEVQFEIEKLLETSPAARLAIQPYLEAIDESSGSAYENRRELESGIQQLNKAVNDYFETAATGLQDIYPSYFEKFRTDGVEYDIYVGQSIAPKRPFLKEYLERMKRWQLESMVEVVRLTHDLKATMDFPLQTTQLLFIHPQTIDITFRRDERRFDVEGAYNIRYHIIKKRIDKVVILDSDERLTQPGKIALVYFDERDAAEYKGYIKRLQERHLLLEDLEELELESLQGVDGLKALRVGVRVEVGVPVRKSLV